MTLHPKPRHGLVLAALLGSMLALGCASEDPYASVPSSVDSLILVELGAVEPSDLSSMASFETLRATATQFEWAFAQSPDPLPSEASVLTGLYPTAHGIVAPTDSLAEGTATLAGLLSAAGWRTARFRMPAGVQASSSLDAGFETTESGPDAVSVARAASAWMDAAAEPSFLLVQLTGTPASRDEALQMLLDATEASGRADTTVLALHGSPQRGGVPATDSMALPAMALPATERSATQAPSESTETALLTTRTTRVPLIIRAGDAAGPRAVETPVELVDLPTTLLDLGGVEIPYGLQGDSLVPLLAGLPRPRSFAYTELPGVGRAVALAGWRLLMDERSRSVVLHDLLSEGGEGIDLAAAEPRRTEVLRRHLDDWQAANERIRAGEGADLSEDELEGLRNLGYIQ